MDSSLKLITLSVFFIAAWVPSLLYISYLAGNLIDLLDCQENSLQEKYKESYIPETLKVPPHKDVERYIGNHLSHIFFQK